MPALELEGPGWDGVGQELTKDLQAIAGVLWEGLLESLFDALALATNWAVVSGLALVINGLAFPSAAWAFFEAMLHGAYRLPGAHPDFILRVLIEGPWALRDAVWPVLDEVARLADQAGYEAMRKLNHRADNALIRLRVFIYAVFYCIIYGWACVRYYRFLLRVLWPCL